MKVKEIKSPRAALEFFHSCLCGGTIGFGSYFIDTLSDDDWDKAKHSLLSSEDFNGFEVDGVRHVCVEDVFAHALEIGLILAVKYRGCTETERLINLQNIRDGIDEVDINRYVKITQGLCDSIDTDFAMQEMLFGKVIHS